LAEASPQPGKEPLPILVLLENQLAAVAAVHDVINRSRILHPHFPGHDRSLASCAESVITKTCVLRD
jgi:hypothetical protein